MIYVLHGDDDFTMGEAVASMKEKVGLPDVRDVNVTELDGGSVGLEELVAVSSTVPFLADKRLVIVNGLLSRFERRRRARQGSKPSPKLGEWAGLADRLAEVPPTTDLVFVDGPVGSANPLLKSLGQGGHGAALHPAQSAGGRQVDHRPGAGVGHRDRSPGGRRPGRRGRQRSENDSRRAGKAGALPGRSAYPPGRRGRDGILCP